jgi:hypothetical protein
MWYDWSRIPACFSYRHSRCMRPTPSAIPTEDVPLPALPVSAAGAESSYPVLGLRFGIIPRPRSDSLFGPSRCGCVNLSIFCPRVRSLMVHDWLWNINLKVRRSHMVEFDADAALPLVPSAVLKSTSKHSPNTRRSYPP